MTLTILDHPQRSPEWFAARAGRLTGSVAGDILAKLKSGGEPAARRDLRLQLAIERLTGQPAQPFDFVSADMQRGIDLEPEALQRIESLTGMMIRQTGFIVRDDLAVGCSLDGDCGRLKTIVEVKCPKTFTHVNYLMEKRLPPAYVAQVTHNLWVTGAKACLFASYDPRLPKLELFSIEVLAKDLDIEGYDRAAREFLVEVDSQVGALRNMQESMA